MIDSHTRVEWAWSGWDRQESCTSSFRGCEYYRTYRAHFNVYNMHGLHKVSSSTSKYVYNNEENVVQSVQQQLTVAEENIKDTPEESSWHYAENCW